MVAAGLLQWAPQFVTPLALVAYAGAAFMVATLRLRGVPAAVGIVAVVVLAQLLGPDLGVGPIRDLADQAPSLDGLAPGVGR